MITKKNKRKNKLKLKHYEKKKETKQVYKKGNGHLKTFQRVSFLKANPKSL